MKNEFYKFEKMIKIEYPEILIRGIQEENFNIYYYLENFDINDLEFHKKFGRCLVNSFTEEQLKNIGTEFLLESELTNYFENIFLKNQIKREKKNIEKYLENTSIHKKIQQI